MAYTQTFSVSLSPYTIYYITNIHNHFKNHIVMFDVNDTVVCCISPKHGEKNNSVTHSILLYHYYH